MIILHITILIFLLFTVLHAMPYRVPLQGTEVSYRTLILTDDKVSRHLIALMAFPKMFYVFYRVLDLLIRYSLKICSIEAMF
jgi:hypothetical protein